jgi:hypothetical protein
MIIQNVLYNKKQKAHTIHMILYEHKHTHLNIHEFITQ